MNLNNNEIDIIEDQIVGIDDVGQDSYKILCDQPSMRKKYAITEDDINSMLKGDRPGLIYSDESNSHELGWAFIKDVDFKKFRHPETNEPVRFSFDGCTLVNCKTDSETFSRDCLIIGGITGMKSAFSRCNIRNGNGLILGRDSVFDSCSLHQVKSVGIGSVISAHGRYGMDECHISAGCIIYGGKLEYCTYDEGVQVLHNDPTNINKSIESKLRDTENLWGVRSWLHNASSEHRLATSNRDYMNTRIMYPSELKDSKFVINHPGKGGHIDDFIQVKIDGKLDYQRYQNRYVLDKLEAEVELIDKHKLRKSLSENKDAMKDVVFSFLNKEFPIMSLNQDMFAQNAIDNSDIDYDQLSEVITDAVSEGIIDTRENCNSHKDLSNDHTFAQNIVNIIKDHIGEVSYDERVKRYAVGPEDIKRMITDVVVKVSALHEFEVIKEDKIKYLADSVSSVSSEFSGQLTKKEIEQRLRADMLENRQVGVSLNAAERPVHKSDIQAELFNGMA